MSFIKGEPKTSTTKKVSPPIHAGSGDPNKYENTNFSLKLHGTKALGHTVNKNEYKDCFEQSHSSHTRENISQRSQARDKVPIKRDARISRRTDDWDNKVTAFLHNIHAEEKDTLQYSSCKENTRSNQIKSNMFPRKESSEALEPEKQPELISENRNVTEEENSEQAYIKERENVLRKKFELFLASLKNTQLTEEIRKNTEKSINSLRKKAANKDKGSNMKINEKITNGINKIPKETNKQSYDDKSQPDQYPNKREMDKTLPKPRTTGHPLKTSNTSISKRKSIEQNINPSKRAKLDIKQKQNDKVIDQDVNNYYNKERQPSTSKKSFNARYVDHHGTIGSKKVHTTDASTSKYRSHKSHASYDARDDHYSVTTKDRPFEMPGTGKYYNKTKDIYSENYRKRPHSPIRNPSPQSKRTRYEADFVNTSGLEHTQLSPIQKDLNVKHHFTDIRNKQEEDEVYDLRTILKRKNDMKKITHPDKVLRKCTREPDETKNLETIKAQLQVDDNDKPSSSRVINKVINKNRSRKKFKVLIKVICEDSSSSSDCSEGQSRPPCGDVSFLDDINVDEIVSCLIPNIKKAYQITSSKKDIVPDNSCTKITTLTEDDDDSSFITKLNENINSKEAMSEISTIKEGINQATALSFDELLEILNEGPTSSSTLDKIIGTSLKQNTIKPVNPSDEVGNSESVKTKGTGSTQIADLKKKGCNKIDFVKKTDKSEETMKPLIVKNIELNSSTFKDTNNIIHNKIESVDTSQITAPISKDINECFENNSNVVQGSNTVVKLSFDDKRDCTTKVPSTETYDRNKNANKPTAETIDINKICENKCNQNVEVNMQEPKKVVNQFIIDEGTCEKESRINKQQNTETHKLQIKDLTDDTLALNTESELPPKILETTCISENIINNLNSYPNIEETENNIVVSSKKCQNTLIRDLDKGGPNDSTFEGTSSTGNPKIFSGNPSSIILNNNKEITTSKSCDIVTRNGCIFSKIVNEDNRKEIKDAKGNMLFIKSVDSKMSDLILPEVNKSSKSEMGDKVSQPKDTYIKNKDEKSIISNIKTVEIKKSTEEDSTSFLNSNSELIKGQPLTPSDINKSKIVEVDHNKVSQPNITKHKDDESHANIIIDKESTENIEKDINTAIKALALQISDVTSIDSNIESNKASENIIKPITNAREATASLKLADGLKLPITIPIENNLKIAEINSNVSASQIIDLTKIGDNEEKSNNSNIATKEITNNVIKAINGVKKVPASSKPIDAKKSPITIPTQNEPKVGDTNHNKDTINKDSNVTAKNCNIAIKGSKNVNKENNLKITEINSNVSASEIIDLTQLEDNELKSNNSNIATKKITNEVIKAINVVQKVTASSKPIDAKKSPIAIPTQNEPKASDTNHNKDTISKDTNMKAKNCKEAIEGSKDLKKNTTQANSGAKETSSSIKSINESKSHAKPTPIDSKIKDTNVNKQNVTAKNCNVTKKTTKNVSVITTKVNSGVKETPPTLKLIEAKKSKPKLIATSTECKIADTNQRTASTKLNNAANNTRKDTNSDIKNKTSKVTVHKESQKTKSPGENNHTETAKSNGNNNKKVNETDFGNSSSKDSIRPQSSVVSSGITPSTTGNKSKVLDITLQKDLNSKTQEKKEEDCKGTVSTKDNAKIISMNKLANERTDVSNKDDKTIAELINKKLATYDVMSLVHEGKYSKIFKLNNSYSGSTPCVVKYFKKVQYWKCEKILTIIQRNSDILNILTLTSRFNVGKNRCFLMTFYPKNLQQAIMEAKKPFHIRKVQTLSRQLVTAVMVLGNLDIIHSDIKPTHVLLNDKENSLKITGFEEAFFATDKSSNFNNARNMDTSSVNYKATEEILGFWASPAIDVFAAGVVIHEMATRRQLFPGHSARAVLRAHLRVLGSLPTFMINQMQNRTHLLDVVQTQTTKSNKLSETLFSTYYSCHSYYKYNERDLYLYKELLATLDKMLVPVPQFRPSIHLVYNIMFGSAHYALDII